MNIRQKSRKPHQFCDRTCYGKFRQQDALIKEKTAISAALGRAVVRTKYGNPMRAPGALNRLSISKKKTNAEQRARNGGLTNSQMTLFERYGVTCPYQLPEVRARAHSEAAQIKRIATASNNVSRTSKVEDEYFEALKRRYGDDQVLRQVINDEHKKWAIDFYVVPLHTFVQLDDVYWHGLDRPLELIREFVHSRDRIIYQKWLTDREQDEAYKRRGIRLIRVTDLQFKKGIVLP